MIKLIGKQSEDADSMSTDVNSSETIPSWPDLEDTGAGDGVPTECERCGKPGTPRQRMSALTNCE